MHVNISGYLKSPQTSPLYNHILIPQLCRLGYPRGVSNSVGFPGFTMNLPNSCIPEHKHGYLILARKACCTAKLSCMLPVNLLWSLCALPRPLCLVATPKGSSGRHVRVQCFTLWLPTTGTCSEVGSMLVSYTAPRHGAKLHWDIILWNCWWLGFVLTDQQILLAMVLGWVVTTGSSQE